PLYWASLWVVAVCGDDEEERRPRRVRGKIGARHALRPAAVRLVGEPASAGEPPRQGREDHRVVPGERRRGRPGRHLTPGTAPDSPQLGVLLGQRRDVVAGGGWLPPEARPGVAAAEPAPV